jgi:YVTN family beta-propeller protein
MAVRYLKTSRGPRDLHFNADRTRLYVACADDDVIDVVDVAGMEVVDRIHTPQRPESFVIDEERRQIYVVNRAGTSLSVIDMAENIVIRDIAADAGPRSVFAGGDRRFVYVAATVSDVVDRIDLDRGHVVDSVIVGTEPHRMAATPGGGLLLVSSALSAEIHFISTPDFTVAGRLRFASLRAAEGRVTIDDFLLTQDGKTAYVALGLLGRIAVLDVPMRRITTYIETGGRLANIGLSRDGKTLFVSGVSSAGITAIDVSTGKMTATIPLNRRPWAFVIDD